MWLVLFTSALLLLLGVLHPVDAISITKKVDRVENVTIYGSSQVSQVFLAVVIDDPLPAGIHSVTLTGLSTTMDDRSVEISGVGVAQILDIKLMSTTIPFEHDEAFIKLRNTMTAQRADLVSRSKTAAQELKILLVRNNSWTHYANTVLNASVWPEKSLDEFASFLDFQDVQLKKLSDDMSASVELQEKVHTEIRDTDAVIQNLKYGKVFTLY
jgi:fumarate reductase subunit D